MQTLIGTDVRYAATLLQKGEVVAVPTETVYGLAANALDEEAVLKIYEAKQRPRFNPLILHVGTYEKFSAFAHSIPEACWKLAKRFTPGPLTFLLPKKSLVPDLVTAGSDKVALRVPDHPMTRNLLSLMDFPLAAPSANPSGYISPVTAEHVLQGLQGRIPYILDGGPCTVGLESTIIGFEPSAIILYRQGAINAEDIEKVTGLPVLLHKPTEITDTPGQLKSHYAPHKPLMLGDPSLLIPVHSGKRIAVIGFRTNYSGAGVLYSFVLSPSGDLHEAARSLFHVLREVDQSDAELIIAEACPDEGVGRAINDRLERAQAIHKQTF